MARQKPDDVIKELKNQDDENYGDETISGTSPVSGEAPDVDDMMDDVVGEDHDEEEELDIAEEIEGDEEEIKSGEINDYQDDEDEASEETVPQDNLVEIEKEENLTQTDPMDSLTDEDLVGRDGKSE